MKLSKKEFGDSACYLTANCLKEWIPAIEANKKIYDVKKGEVIFNEGDPVTGIYFVYSGIFKVHKKWGDDKELILRFAPSGSIVGHRGLSTKSNIYPMSATALQNGVVCFVDIDFFYSTLKVNTDFAFKLLMFFADELQESERKMRNLAHMSVKGRLALALISLKNQFSVDDEGGINIELSRQDISSVIGATYETVFRVINELIADGAITTTKRNIKILDEEKLVSFSTQEG